MLGPAHPARGPRHHVQRLHAAAGVPTLGLPSCRVGARTLRALVSGVLSDTLSLAQTQGILLTALVAANFMMS